MDFFCGGQGHVFHKHLVVLLKVHVVLLNHIAARSYRLCLCSYYIYIIFMCLDCVLSIKIIEMVVFLLKIQGYAQ